MRNVLEAIDTGPMTGTDENFLVLNQDVTFQGNTVPD